MGERTTADHCADLVKAAHHPRFIASLFAPEAVRGHLYALYALDSELAHITDAAREPLIRAMRYQWWRDALSKLPDAPRGHPVLTQLAVLPVPPDALIAIIDAHEGGAPEQCQRLVMTLAVRLCGGANDAMAVACAAALATNDRARLAEARRLWSAQRHQREAELPAYLPATIVDMRHPVTPLRLNLRMLWMGLRGRF